MRHLCATITAGVAAWLRNRNDPIRYSRIYCSTIFERPFSSVMFDGRHTALLRCRREGKKRITVRAKPVRTSYYVSSYSPHSSEWLKVFFLFLSVARPIFRLGTRRAHDFSRKPEGRPGEMPPTDDDGWPSRESRAKNLRRFIRARMRSWPRGDQHLRTSRLLPYAGAHSFGMAGRRQAYPVSN